MRTLASILIMVLFGAAHAGCIVRDIRDSLYTANSQLDDVDKSLQKLNAVNESLALTNESLTHVNQRLTAVDQELGAINSGQETLQQRLDSQLKTLKSIDGSLSRLDQHLGALRKTISALDSVIPFVDFGSSDPDPVPPPAPDAIATGPDTPASAAQPTGADPVPPPAPAGPASARREPLIGTWISQYPDRSTALVIAPDGRFILLAHPGGRRTDGSWSRTNPRTLRLTPDAPAPPPAPPAAADGADKTESAAAPGAPPTAPSTAALAAPIDLIILAHAGRSVTVELDGKTLILGWP